MNTSNSNTLAARISAEGLPKVSTIAKAIGVVGESMKSHGLDRVTNGAVLTNLDLAKDLVHMVSYTGGYMYPADYCYIVSRETGNKTTITAPVVHTARDYDNRELTTERKAAWIEQCLAILDSHSQALNLELVVGNQTSGDNNSYTNYNQITPGCWQLSCNYDQWVENMEDNSVFLPEGIRALVAKHLNVHTDDKGELSVTFHRAFDAAVEHLHGN